jgi:hypothetical protein
MDEENCMRDNKKIDITVELDSWEYKKERHTLK